MSGTIIVAILIVCVVAAAAGITYRNRARRRNKVVQLARFRKQPDKRKQKCSYCKKMSDRLTFYAGAHGSAVGVCKHCRPKAEKQDLMPL